MAGNLGGFASAGADEIGAGLNHSLPRVPLLGRQPVLADAGQPRGQAQRGKH
jgi:hypothetical protein